jgi:hypothetical protein
MSNIYFQSSAVEDLKFISYILDTAACLFLLYLYIHEIKSLIKNGYREYFNDTWNFVDMTLFFTFVL